ncbi:MAG TPA: hypothetical protein VF810_00735 [Patescibacteria group bacterium]
MITLLNPQKINEWNKKLSKSYKEKPMKELIVLPIVLFVVSFIVFLSTSGGNSENEVKGDLNQISVSTEFQRNIDGKQKVVVWVQNNSPYKFSGNLSMIFKSTGNNVPIDNDTVFVENLVAGQKTYSILWCKPASSITAEWSWSSTSFIEKVKDSESDSAYKMIKDKTDSGGAIVPKLEFFLATDRNYNNMYQFIKNREIDKGYLYHAVFVDDEKYAQFSKYPISAMMFDENVSKHIVATYVCNPSNNYKDFTYYEKNSFESKPQSLKD